MLAPLADKIRPQTLEDVVGQKHILAKGKPLYRAIMSGNISNFIFYGPPGTGKTTVSEIIARQTNKSFVKINGTTAKTTDIQEVIRQSDSILGLQGTILYIDEIQYLNKKQQQTILEVIENGKITLIASTTENPYFYVYPAIISRSVVFEFRMVQTEDIMLAVQRSFSLLEQEKKTKILCEPQALQMISACAMGDVRKALNFAEFCFESSYMGEQNTEITTQTAGDVCSSAKTRYDKDADAHYDILSAFQKSIRGSDPDAAVHYLARLLEAGDIISPARRLLVTASEDIGLAYPLAASIVKSLVDSAFQLGLPEARIPLAQAVLFLATCPKSNSAINAIDSAISDIQNGKAGDVPKNLKDAHYSGSEKLGNGKGYLYPHAYDQHYVSQQYLPDTIQDTQYYVYGTNKIEQAAKAYWDQIKKNT